MTLSRGDPWSGIIGLGGLTPVAGNYLDALKIARRLDRARELGRAGERAAGISDAPKKAIQVDGKNLFPDKWDEVVLKESKNFAKQSYTRQLRSYNKYAKANGLKFELWTRQDTKLSGPLKQAIADGDIIHKCFFGPC